MNLDKYKDPRYAGKHHMSCFDRGHSEYNDLMIDMYEAPDCNCSMEHCTNCLVRFKFGTHVDACLDEAIKHIRKLEDMLERYEKKERVFHE